MHNIAGQYIIKIGVWWGFSGQSCGNDNVIVNILNTTSHILLRDTLY